MQKAFRVPAALILALAVLSTVGTDRASGQTNDPQDAAVRQAVQDLVDSWREADAAKGDAVLHPQFRLTTRRDNHAADDPGPHGPLPAVDVADRAAMMRIYGNLQPGGWDDRLSDVVVHRDRSGMATVWANYRFHMNGRQTHCGAVSLTLYRTAERWQIIEFADTHHWAQPGEANGCASPTTL